MKKIRKQIISNKTKFLIPLLLLSLAITFSFTIGTVSATVIDASSNNAIIYVNDSSGSDDNNGTSWEYAKKSIKNATEAIDTNGTIKIADGEYKGENNTNILINKNMTITGLSPEGIILNGTGHIFYIGPELNVLIQNLILTNGHNSFGGAIYNKGTLTVENCTFIKNMASQAGGAIINWYGTLNVTNCTFTGNNGSSNLDGGAIANSGNCTVNDCTFSDNKANNGGAIYNYLGNLSVNSSTFSNNNATNNGGAIFNLDGNSIFNDCKFTNNIANNIGGAIFNNGTSATIECAFTDNNAYMGGAIFNYFRNITVEKSTFINNTADILGASGAIVNLGTLNVTECNFINNSAGTGGAISNLDGNCTVNNSNFTGNTATHNTIGGAAILNTGILNINCSTFTGNNATTSDGAAIYSQKTINVSSSTFTGNKGGAIINDHGNLNISGSTFTDNSAMYFGGSVSTDGNCTISCSTFTNNNAHDGSAISNWINLTVSNCNFNGNNAIEKGTIYSEGNSTITDCNFSNNIANIGGAIYSNETSTVNGCNFNNNTANDTIYGGAAIFSAGILNITCCTFTVNNATASDGAAVYNTNGTLKVTESNFTDNAGGAIINDYGNLIVKESTFTGNSAAYFGGAIWTGVNCTIFSSTFTNNVAGNGSAIYNWGNLTIFDSDFANNYAAEYAGAIYNEGLLIIYDSDFNNNNATSGGAIYNNGTSNVIGCNFENNVVNASGFAIGGAIRNLGNLAVINSDFENNTASGDWNVMGGAIGNYCLDDDASSVNSTIINCRFTSNSAQLGGAILNLCYNLYGSGSANCNVIDCIFLKNSADRGGAICNRCYSMEGSGSANCNITGCTFINNSASEEGGALFNIGNSTTFNSTLNANFNRFHNNQATYGNALYCNSGSVNVTNNWWGSNENPKSISNLIAGTVDDVDADSWVILTVNANPTTINNTGNSTITADLNHYMNSNGQTGTLADYIPDGLITINVPWGSLISPSLTLGALFGSANLPLLIGASGTGSPGNHSITLNTVEGLVKATFLANEGAVPSENPIKVTAAADSYTTNSTESAYITIKKSGNLYIQITSNNNSPIVGQKFTVTYKLGNNGPDNATNVITTIPLPEGFELISISGDGSWTYNAATRTITWTLENVPVGDPYLYIYGKVTKSGTLVFSYSINSGTFNINTQGIVPVTINVAAITSGSGKTIGMQKTGIPIISLLLAVLTVIGGLVVPRRK